MSKRQTYRPPWPRYGQGSRLTYSPAARKGNVLALSGLASTDQDGNVLWPGDIVAQTRQTYDNIKAVLEAAGASFDDVIKTVEYIVPDALEGYKGTAAVRREYFKGDFPAATGIVVHGLVKKGMLIEIDVYAVVD